MIRLREARSDDIPDLADLHLTTWQRVYASMLPQTVLDSLTLEGFIRSWTSILAQPPSDAEHRHTIIALEDEKVVGFCCFGPSRNRDRTTDLTGEIYAIYVDLDHWRSGIGSLLLHWSRAELERAGFQSITLWVLEKNETARRFYERHGFAAAGPLVLRLVRGVPAPEIRYQLEFTLFSDKKSLSAEGTG